MDGRADRRQEVEQRACAERDGKAVHERKAGTSGGWGVLGREGSLK